MVHRRGSSLSVLSLQAAGDGHAAGAALPAVELVLRPLSIGHAGRSAGHLECASADSGNPPLQRGTAESLEFRVQLLLPLPILDSPLCAQSPRFRVVDA